MFRSVCFLGLLGVVILPATAWPQETAVVQVTEDTWIHGLASTSNRGTSTRLTICPSAGYWVYLNFDLGDVAGQIAGAELRMVRFDGSRPNEISVYSIPDDSWSEFGSKT